jgi:hypothetical protein
LRCSWRRGRSLLLGTRILRICRCKRPWILGGTLGVIIFILRLGLLKDFPNCIVSSLLFLQSRYQIMLLIIWTVVHRYGATSNDFESFLANRNSSVSWHSDVSYEAQPPGTTFLYIFDTPEVGGDTLFANQVEAYNRLSENLKERLHGLKAVHSGFEQAQFSRDRDGMFSGCAVVEV